MPLKRDQETGAGKVLLSPSDLDDEDDADGSVSTYKVWTAIGKKTEKTIEQPELAKRVAIKYSSWIEAFVASPTNNPLIKQMVPFIFSKFNTLEGLSMGSMIHTYVIQWHGLIPMSQRICDTMLLRNPIA